jgi:hypothetical protein
MMLSTTFKNGLYTTKIGGFRFKTVFGDFYFGGSYTIGIVQRTTRGWLFQEFCGHTK